MIRAIQYFTIFLATLISAKAMSDAPKSPLYLVCESHLIAISTSVNQKIVNALEAQPRASISFDVRTLWEGREAGGPIDMDDIGWASREVINLAPSLSDYGYQLNRISGKLVWREKRKRPKNSRSNCAFDCDEIYWAVRAEYECEQETRSRLNEIIKDHNRSVKDSQPKRRF
jgi:hypothetical protein